MAARAIAAVLALLGVLIVLGTGTAVVRTVMLIREHGLEFSTMITVGSWPMTMVWFLVLCAGVFLVGLALIGGAVWFWTMSGQRDNVRLSSP